MIKIRIFPEHNYKGLYFNGKTLRIALDPTLPIGELVYPEFYDIKVTSYCRGECPWCYQDSTCSSRHDPHVIDKFKAYFGGMSENMKPFQIAFGGGEPTEHPLFTELLRECAAMGIVPNYTTNGMWVTFDKKRQRDIMGATVELCGGVAVSTHPHLKKQWERAVNEYLRNDVFTNLHVIISNRASIDNFVAIYERYVGRVKYFVLLPLIPHGRAKEMTKEAMIDWEYFSKTVNGNPPDIAFGANFYPYLCKDPKRFKVSLYEPEIMSKYLDLETMKVYPSSFHTEPVKIENERWVSCT